MCRLLSIRSKKEFSIPHHLKIFAGLCKNSKEYQGHGWGCAYLDKNKNWKYYRNIKPIWEDDLEQFGKTTLLIAHARSAFEDKGIEVKNNMPFYDDSYVYVFNGELRGVKIKENGRIGAEKIFNFIKRFNKGDMLEALRKGIGIIKKKARYVKALNIIISDKQNFYLASVFNKDPEYFTMHYKETLEQLIICSEPYADDWKKIENGTIKVF